MVERRGQTNEEQRGWHPTGKVLGNVVGGVIGKLRGENLMQNGPGGEEEERRYGYSSFGLQNTNGQEKRQGGETGGTGSYQNGVEGEEERRGTSIFDPSSKIKVYDCPTGFEKIEGIEHKCFYFHTDSNGTMDTPTFAQAVQICKGKKSTIFDPNSLDEGQIVQRVVQKRPHKYFTVWLNYQDIDMKATLIQDETVLMDSKYMGSLSTFTKIPDEWWGPTGKEYSYNLTDYHCAVWTCGKYPTKCAVTGVYKSMCDTGNALVCEVGGSSNLRQYVTDFNYDNKRQGENMMQNGPGGEEKRYRHTCMQGWCPDGEKAEEERRGSNINEMQNGGEAEEERRGSNINEMQNGGEVEEASRKMCMQGPDGKPDEHLCQ